VNRKEIGEADDEHDGSILDVDDVVVADLRDDVSESLRKDDTGHRLPVGHADRHGAFGLSGIDGNNSAADGFRHVGSGVDRDHEDGHRPEIRELNRII